MNVRNKSKCYKKNIIKIRRVEVVDLMALAFWVTPNMHMRYLFIFYFNMLEECHGRRDVGKLGIISI